MNATFNGMNTTKCGMNATYKKIAFCQYSEIKENILTERDDTVILNYPSKFHKFSGYSRYHYT